MLEKYQCVDLKWIYNEVGVIIFSTNAMIGVQKKNYVFGFIIIVVIACFLTFGILLQHYVLEPVTRNTGADQTLNATLQRG